MTQHQLQLELGIYELRPIFIFHLYFGPNDWTVNAVLIYKFAE